MRAAIAFMLSLCLTAQAFALDAAIGRKMFLRAWVPAPASTKSDDGLGPLFDARSCASCHPDLNRPAVPLSPGQEAPRALVTRISDANGAPDPVYGQQLQREAIGGNRLEAGIWLRRSMRIIGGQRLGFFEPQLRHLGYGPLAKTTSAHFRLAPPLIGLATLEAVEDNMLVNLSQTGVDGIHGKVPRLPDGRIGRFGFKAQDPDLMTRIAAAFHSDMGMSTVLQPAPWGDCTKAQHQCRKGPHGAPDAMGLYEIDVTILGQIAEYLRSIEAQPAAVPDANGLALFRKSGCHACHNEKLGGGSPLYSDLLLHDMGEGLASSGPQGAATAREWRTAPLRGLGQTVQQKAPLLHDGRAATIKDAIKWHDGAARTSRTRFFTLPRAEQAELLRFLAGL